MVETTASYERLNLASENHSLSLSPDVKLSIGPYIGWRWIFLGYKFALNDNARTVSKSTEFELSLYGSMLSCDLIYRRTGDDFKWSFDGQQLTPNASCTGGVKLETIGANVYYIFNHRRFSLPSLFAQSTVQKRSQGSWMMGASISRHRYRFDVKRWPSEVEIFDDINDAASMRYMNYALSVGYGYNWVIHRNLMLGFSFMPAFGYKHIVGNSDVTNGDGEDGLANWISNNLNVDVTARAALVWNIGKRYAGISVIIHNYNFARQKATIHNTFGTVNVYLGLNFIKRREYR